jgi:hypothetical protein
LWDDSDPNSIQRNGRTKSGLFRYFRNFRLSADIDEYGFHKIEEAEENREIVLDSYMAKGDLEGLSDYKRKFPDTIEEALATPAGDCPLFPVLLDDQMERLRLIANGESEEEKSRLEVRGDLVWSNGVGSKVAWIPNPQNGKWFISRHPHIANNNHKVSGKFMPGNAGIFTMGVDSIDHYKPEARHSDGSISVFMPFNPAMEERELVYLDDEIQNVEDMMTDQFVCFYRYRPEDPYEFYDDVYKTMFYYGIPAFIERDKPTVINEANRLGLAAYLSYKSNTLGVGAKESRPGAKTSIQLTHVFVDMVKMHIAKRIKTYRHMAMLADFRKFDGGNMVKCDGLVSAGYALMDANKYNYIKKPEREQWAVTPW